MARTIPSLAQQQPGNYNTSALENNIRYAISYFAGVPVFAGYQASTQSVGAGSYASFTIDTELIDTDGGHSTVTNTSRYVAQVPGTYLVIGSSGWGASNTGYRRTRIALNGNAVRGATGFDQNQIVTSAGLAVSIVTMNGTTDYVEVQGAQNSGGTLSTFSSADFCPTLTVLWVSS